MVIDVPKLDSFVQFPITKRSYTRSGTSPETGGRLGQPKTLPHSGRNQEKLHLLLGWHDSRRGAPYSPKARICGHFQQLLILDLPAHIDNHLSIR